MSDNWTTVNTSKAEKEEDKVEFEIEGQEEQAQVDEPIQVSKEGDEPQEVETKAEVQEESSKGDEPQSGAQKRIRQLVKQKKERDEQINQLVQRQQELEERLKAQQQELKTSLEKSFESAEEQINSRIAMAKDAYKQALESGDTDRIVMAQEALSTAQTDASTLKIAKRYEQPKQEEVVQQQVQQPQQQSTQYDRLAVEWAGRNPWFGQDNVMTTLALEVDAELKAEGYDPSDGDFYQEIDSRLKAKFPQRFSAGQEPTQERQQEASNPAQVVGGASRTSTASQSGKKVRLSKEDIRLAEKWGIPLEQYAAEKLKVEKADGEYTSVQF